MKFAKFLMLGVMAIALSACGSARRTNVIEPVDVRTTPRVFFAFDRYDITPEARNNLLGQSLFLKQNEHINITIEGHADERGTLEYNFALGARRANAARQVLINDGICPNRIHTVSYSWTRPYRQGTGEAVWRYNRNATTVVR